MRGLWVAVLGVGLMISSGVVVRAETATAGDDDAQDVPGGPEGAEEDAEG